MSKRKIETITVTPAKTATNKKAKTTTTKILTTTDARSGLTRKSGYYGRFGLQATRLGMIPENKFFDTTLGFAFPTTALASGNAAQGQMALIPQGDTESTRDGRQCEITSIYIKGNITMVPAAAAQCAANVFLMVIQDLQANGAAPVYSDIFTGTAAWANHINLANSSRFKVLKKWKIKMEPKAGATTAWNNTTQYIEWYKPCSIPMEFSGATGAITEIKSNNLILAYGTDANTGVCTLSAVSRLRFRG